MSEKIKVISVEDNESYRKMIKEFLRNNNDIELVKEFVSAEGLLKYLKKNEGKSIDVILLDLNLPGTIQGIDAIPEILLINENINILVLTIDNNDKNVLNSIKAGAKGYVLKDNTQDELI
ncbi:MAG: response regulator transcription factor, partial [Ignavibacteriaceae bacterium]|nr:response regulator transcription factor [Ignavibacteriaceae bacterium]